MLEIPLAWLVTVLAILSALLLVQAPRLPIAARTFLVSSLGGMALVGLMLGLRTGYQFDAARYVQVVIAIMTLPCAYLGLAAFSVEEPYPWRRVALTYLVPHVLAVVAVLVLGLGAADLLIPAVTLINLAFLMRLGTAAPETFVHVAPDRIRQIRVVILLVGAIFALFVTSDIAILLALMWSGPEAIGQMLNISTQVLALVTLAATVVGIPFILFRPDAPTPPADDAAPDDEDWALLARFDAMLLETRAYADNSLTLARAARRLGVPARALSRAVNRAGGSNLSRFINGYRIRYAEELLTSSEVPVTEIMLEAGFVSKSTFNAEFRRITGTTPSAYRASAKAS